MKEELIKFIGELKIKNEEFSGLNKDILKNSIVLPILKILNWDYFNYEEVYPSYSNESQTVDYCLRINKESKVFIKVVNSKEGLDVEKEQLLNYAVQEKVDIAILTNALIWNFYLPMDSNENKKLYFQINILDRQEKEEIANNFIHFLSKDEIEFDTAQQTIKDLYISNIDNSIIRTWNTLIKEMNCDLIKVLIDTIEKTNVYKYSNEQIKKFLYDNKDFLLLSEINSLPNKRIIDLINNGCRGKKPEFLILDGKRILVKNWSDILIETCNYLCSGKGEDFRKNLLSLERQDKTHYFSKFGTDFAKAQKIKDSDIYVGISSDDDELFRLTKKIIEIKWGEGNNNWDIELKQKSNNISKDIYTGRKPTSFMLDNKKILINNWRNLLAETCNFLYDKHLANFEKKVLENEKYKQYFSYDPDNLRKAVQIKNSKLYVEENMSASYIVALCENLMSLFGYTPDLHIEIRQE